MKYLYILLLFSISLFKAQEIEKDIFGNYTFKAEKSNFSAKLEKDIFNHIIYTDNKSNKIIYEHKYVVKYFPELFKSEDFTMDFFWGQMDEYSVQSGYKQKFEIDIFNTEKISDNRNNKQETKIDIFGKYQYEDQFKGIKTKVFQDTRGNWTFSRGENKATLEKNYQDSYVYSDSNKNKIDYNTSSFERLKKQFGGEKEVFFFLVNAMLD